MKVLFLILFCLAANNTYSQAINDTTLAGLWRFEVITDTLYASQDSVITDTLVTRNDSTFQSYADSLFLTSDAYDHGTLDSPASLLMLKNCKGFLNPDIAHLLNLEYVGAGWYFDANRYALVFLIPVTGQELVYNITGWDGTYLSLCSTDLSGNQNESGELSYPKFNNVLRIRLRKES